MESGAAVNYLLKGCLCGAAMDFSVHERIDLQFDSFVVPGYFP